MVTIGDVARHLGVSRSTVSYALTGKRPVSELTKHRVADAIAELDFVPSTRARALAGARSRTLAALAPMGPDAAPPIALQFINGTAQASRRRDHDLLLVVGDEAVHGIDRLLRSDRADGLILFDVTEDDPRLAKAARSQKPTVMIGCPTDEAPIDSVDLDWQAAGTLMVEHLTRHGHRSIGLLGAQPAAYARHLAYAERFRAGARGAAERAGAHLHEWPATPHLAATAASLRALFEAHPDTTALAIQQESIVPHIRPLLAGLGLRIPHDISVVGMGLDALASETVAPISGVDNPSATLTATAVDLLIDRIEARDPAREPRRVLIPPHFDDRATTAAVT